MQRLEPKTFLASERTFLAWLHMAITIASIAAALLAFAAGSAKSKSPMHTVGGGACRRCVLGACVCEPCRLANALTCSDVHGAALRPRPLPPPRWLQVSANLVEIIALVLLPLAVFICAYATLVFVWRNSQIALKQAAYIDDRRGPLLLASGVIAALSAIFIVSCVDMWDSFHESNAAMNALLGRSGGVGVGGFTSSLSTPHNVLPSALSVPLVLGGAGGGNGVGVA